MVQSWTSGWLLDNNFINCKLLFEAENLDVASPATVSRAGMIFLDLEELGWRPIMRSWIEKKKSHHLG